MHVRHISGIALAAASMLFAASNTLAYQYSLFWRWWWFDIPMHILGGFIVGGGLLWLIAFEVPPGVRPRVNRAFMTFCVVLAIGIAWEIFEYWSGMTRGEPGYWFDTIHDVIDDLIGGGIAYLIFRSYGR